jgi:hypothetical protein
LFGAFSDRLTITDSLLDLSRSANERVVQLEYLDSMTVSVLILSWINPMTLITRYWVYRPLLRSINEEFQSKNTAWEFWSS